MLATSGVTTRNGGGAPTPLIVAERSLACDSGGPGEMRGGLGRKMIIRVPDDEFAPAGPTSIALQAGRFKYAPGGLFGAESGSMARFLINGEAGDPSGLTLCQPGDEIQFHSAGGGGYGDPLKRDTESVEQDVRNGYVSVEKARDDYGVVIDPVSLKVDLEKTTQVRGSSKE